MLQMLAAGLCVSGPVVLLARALRTDEAGQAAATVRVRLLVRAFSFSGRNPDQ